MLRRFRRRYGLPPLPLTSSQRRVIDPSEGATTVYEHNAAATQHDAVTQHQRKRTWGRVRRTSPDHENSSYVISQKTHRRRTRHRHVDSCLWSVLRRRPGEVPVSGCNSCGIRCCQCFAAVIMRTNPCVGRSSKDTSATSYWKILRALQRRWGRGAGGQGRSSEGTATGMRPRKRMQGFSCAPVTNFVTSLPQ